MNSVLKITKMYRASILKITEYLQCMVDNFLALWGGLPDIPAMNGKM